MDKTPISLFGDIYISSKNSDVFIKPIRSRESKRKVKRDERMEVALNDDEEVVSRPHG